MPGVVQKIKMEEKNTKLRRTYSLLLKFGPLTFGMIFSASAYLAPQRLPQQWRALLLSIGLSIVATSIYKILRPLPPKIFAYLMIILLALFLTQVGFYYGSRVDPYPEHGLIADFQTGPGGNARNALGGTFSISTDSEFNGTSKCWYSLETEEQKETEFNNFLRMFFVLEPRLSASQEAYVSLFSNFSFLPPKIYDISRFNNLSIRLRIPSDIEKSRLRLYIAIATDNQPKTPGIYDWCEYLISMSSITSDWVSISIPLSRMAAPYWSNQGRKFDSRRVFQFILAIRCNRNQIIHGHIDIYDIAFIE